MDNRATQDLSDTDRIDAVNRRIDEMAALYLQWGKDAKFRYRGLSSSTMLFSAAVPVIVLVAPLVHSDAQAPWVASVAGILGACATLTKSIDSLFKNHETWLRNNDSYGKLRSERFLFEERAGAYKAAKPEDRISIYADRVEAIIGSQATAWFGTEKTPQAGAS